MYNFNPASKNENIVFGAQRPGYPSGNVTKEAIEQWMDFMKQKGIQRVCCLLKDNKLKYYDSLLSSYTSVFGKENICRAPIEDYHLCDKSLLFNTIIPFLKEADEKGQKTIIHCAGGLGRTGHVLAAWLVIARGYSFDDAISSVISLGRDPLEAVGRGNATRQELIDLMINSNQIES